MAQRIIAALLAGSVVLSSGAALAQDSATVATVTVRAPPREPPPEMLPQYASCLAALSDPYVVALMSIEGIDAAPRIYTSTRLPRNPDYDAPPKSRPGSPLPEVMSLKDYHAYAKRQRNLLRAADQIGLARSGLAEAVETAADEAVAQTPSLADGEFLRMQAVAKCLEPDQRSRSGGGGGLGGRVFLSGPGMQSGPSGPIAAGSARPEILFRDTNLPLGFALFEEGRYEEALEQFKIYDRKIGGPEGALMIGKIYLFGLKEKSDPAEGVRWLKRLTDRPFNARTSTPVFDPKEPERTTAVGEAALILAALYRDGLGPIPRDPAQSRHYLEEAYRFGHIPAAKLLGDVYYEGRDAPRDLKLAFKHYMDAARFAHLPAMIAVADMYDAGEIEGGPDPARALGWRNEAARANDPAALFALAVAYDRGEGVTADADRALSLYKLAAMNGEAAAMTSLGTYFYAGEGGLDHDPATARQWFRAAALNADADGMFNLAAMMAKGEGGEVDRVGAWGWLTIANRLGHPNAAAALAALQTGLGPQEQEGIARLVDGATAPPSPEETGPGEDPELVIDASFVGTAPGGPPWWKVSNGEASVWVMGLPPGRSIETQRWASQPLRKALQGARLALVSYSPWDRLQLPREVGPPLPTAVGLKLHPAAAAAKRPLRARAPSFDTALVIHRVYAGQRSLTERGPSNVLQIIISDERVPPAMAPFRRVSPISRLDPASPGVAACVDAIVADFERPVEESVKASQAWAAGDVTGALAAPPGAAWGCEVLWPGHWERSVGFYTEAIAMALDMPGKVVAAIDIGQLVASDGILPRLRDMGLEVSGPMQPTEAER